MDMPRIIKIGYRMWRTRRHTASENGDRGECLIDPAVLTIRNDLAGVYEAGVLLHELCHAVWEMQGIDLNGLCEEPHKVEEQVVNALSQGLMQVFDDTPQLLEYLKNAVMRVDENELE